MKRIFSFTIIELMITLLISAIVITMAYYAYFLFSAQFATYRTRSAQMNQYHLLATAFQIDCEKADWIRDTLDKNHIVFSCRDTLVFYTLNNRTITRQNADGAVDSFAIEANIKDIRYVSDTLRLIEGIYLDVRVNGEQVPLLVKKLYSSQEIMSAEKQKND